MGWEEETRRDEITYLRRGFWLGTAAAVAGVVTAGAAVWAALAATEAVSTAQEAVQRSSREQRLSNGVESMGGDTSAQRIAGIGLLVRNVTNEMTRVAAAKDDSDDWERDQRDVNASYIATLDALENYIGSWTVAAGDDATTLPAEVQQPPPPNVGYVVPKDVQYAANAVKSLTGERAREAGKTLDLGAAIDLSFAPLSGLNLSAIDVSWLGTFYAEGVDLRNANIANATLGRPTKLIRAHLQCAHLNGADLRGTNLQDADLRGADLTGAKLDGALLLGAKLRDAALTAEQLEEAQDGDRVGGAEALRSEPLPPTECMKEYGEIAR